LGLFKKDDMVTLRVNLKYGNTIKEVFNNYEKALKKLSKLNWTAYDISYEYLNRPKEFEKLSQYGAFDLYFKYTDSEWDLLVLAIEEHGAEIRFRC